MMRNTSITTPKLKVYLHSPKQWINILVISYIFLAYFSGLYMLCSPILLFNLIGLIFLSHSLIYAAFFSHELLHASVFKSVRLNKLVSIPIRWLTGMSYIPYSVASRGHILHHLGKISGKISTSKFPMPTLSNMPKTLSYITIFSEWFYFPLHTYMYLWWRNFSPFWLNKEIHMKLRVSLIFLTRIILLVVFLNLSIKAVFLYFLAYNLMITVIRFSQAFEHTHRYLLDPESKMFFTTFSPLISKKYPWLDILVLNFGYHNSHHILMSCPWYHLPALDKEIFKEQDKHHLSWKDLLINYHKFRINRLLSHKIKIYETIPDITTNLAKFHGVQAAFPF